MIWHRTSEEVQNEADRSFIGGVPLLPDGVEAPIFALNSQRMTFFFQIKLPQNHKEAGRIVSVFCATDHMTDEANLPKLPVNLRQTHLTDDFFDEYQTFFRVLIFDDNNLTSPADFQPRLKFRRLQFGEPPGDDYVHFGFADAEPDWLLEDESPRSFNGDPSNVCFLFQTAENYEYEALPTAPFQKVLNFSEGPRLIDSLTSSYDLFASNACYFFLLKEQDKSRIYIVPQS